MPSAAAARWRGERATADPCHDWSGSPVITGTKPIGSFGPIERSLLRQRLTHNVSFLKDEVENPIQSCDGALQMCTGSARSPFADGVSSPGTDSEIKSSLDEGQDFSVVVHFQPSPRIAPMPMMIKPMLPTMGTILKIILQSRLLNAQMHPMPSATAKPPIIRLIIFGAQGNQSINTPDFWTECFRFNKENLLP